MALRMHNKPPSRHATLFSPFRSIPYQSPEKIVRQAKGVRCFSQYTVLKVKKIQYIDFFLDIKMNVYNM
jgi:hypothetical protein